MARDLAVDHATLSQILRGERRTPASVLRRAGTRLGLSAEEITAYVAAERLPDSDTLHRQEQLRHWTAEARAILAEPHHHGLLQLLHETDFVADVRVVARRLSVTADEVNLAVARLARLGFLAMLRPTEWRDVHALGLASNAAFRRRALARIRELAPMFPKRLRSLK